MSRPLGVLRPEPGNAATAARIEALGHRALRLPLFAVRPITWSPPEPNEYDCLLLTSANAVRHGGTGLAALVELPVHAVGAATAESARAAGFSVVAVGGGGVEAMRPPGRVLRLAGREHHDVGVDTIVVYASDAVTLDLTTLVGGVALIHSSRAARELARRVPDRRDIAVAAISAGAAEGAGPGWRAVAIAGHPTDTALIAAAVALSD